MGGVAIIFWATVLLAFIIIVPSREGAPRGGKFCLVGMALTGIAWGIGQVQMARRKQKELDAAAKRKEHESDV